MREVPDFPNLISNIYMAKLSHIYMTCLRTSTHSLNEIWWKTKITELSQSGSCQELEGTLGVNFKSLLKVTKEGTELRDGETT